MNYVFSTVNIYSLFTLYIVHVFCVMVYGATLIDVEIVVLGLVVGHKNE